MIFRRPFEGDGFASILPQVHGLVSLTYGGAPAVMLFHSSFLDFYTFSFEDGRVVVRGWRMVSEEMGSWETEFLSRM